MDKQRVSFTLGSRLEELRKSKGLTHVALAKQLKEAYGIEVSRDSLMAYEISSEFRAKASKLPNLGMRIEYLYCLADFYGVSLDYLLGKTDVMTPDIKIRDACELTGLSSDTISLLHAYSGCSSEKTTLSSFLTRFLEDIVTSENLHDVCHYLVNAARADAIYEINRRESLDNSLDFDNIVACVDGTHAGTYKISAHDATWFFLSQAEDMMKKGICIILETMEEELRDEFVSAGFISQTPNKIVWRLLEDEE